MTEPSSKDDAAFVQAALGELPEVELTAGLQRRVAQIPILQPRGPTALPSFFRSARWLAALSLACAGLGVLAGLWTGQNLDDAQTGTALQAPQTTGTLVGVVAADSEAEEASLDALLVLAWGEDAAWDEGVLESDDSWSE